MLEQGDIVILQPVSERGIEVLKKHGTEWRYYGSFQDSDALWLALTCPTLVQWVRSTDDIDFRIMNNGNQPHQSSFDI